MLVVPGDGVTHDEAALALAPFIDCTTTRATEELAYVVSSLVLLEAGVLTCASNGPFDARQATS